MGQHKFSGPWPTSTPGFNIGLTLINLNRWTHYGHYSYHSVTKVNLQFHTHCCCMRCAKSCRTAEETPSPHIFLKSVCVICFVKHFTSTLQKCACCLSVHLILLSTLRNWNHANNSCFVRKCVPLSCYNQIPYSQWKGLRKTPENLFSFFLLETFLMS